MALGAIIIVIIAFAVVFLIYSQREKKKLLSEENLRPKLLKAGEFLESVKDNKKGYFRNSKKEELKGSHRELFLELSKRPYKALHNDLVHEFKTTYANLDSMVGEWNDAFVEQEMSAHADLFDNIDGKSLDEQQRRAVVVDEDNNLVLAGAGSGKTLTISAKVKYLVDTKDIDPEKILLISFTRKAAEEMQERIRSRLKIDVEAKTFHKLGLDIISRAGGRRPDVFEGLKDLIDRYFEEEISTDRTLMKDMIYFFSNYFKVPKDPAEFDNLGEACDYNRDMDLETIKSKVELRSRDFKEEKVTIQGEKVRSLEEVMIANYLYLNGVSYTYEKEYPHDSGDQYRKIYRPDFYLDDYDIYLEHFGITEDNKVPWLSEIEERKYLDGITWKRQVHQENRTVLIETYSYFNKNGTLYTELDKLLKSHGVVYEMVDYKTIYEKLFSGQPDRHLAEFKNLVETFIGLFKSRGYSEMGFDSLGSEVSGINNLFLRERSFLFLSIVKPIFIQYQKELDSLGQIDFNDMINKSAELIREGEVEYKPEHIIIDEYQDISVSRYNLIKQLKDKNNAKIMAVGDDWQSIYRFTGSDMDLFTGFQDYFGYSEILKIEKTYRNSQELIDIAGSFIMKNPRQLKKQLVSDKHNHNPVRIYSYHKEIGTAIKNAIRDIVNLNGEKAEIMILGRNNSDINVLESYPDFKVNKTSGSVKLRYAEYPKLNIFFLTVHRSKGLEADNVIVINLVNNIVGFPNKITDDIVLSLVLTNGDDYSFAEERRLFYVAITRSKSFTYLIVPDRDQSVFAEELIKTNNIPYNFSTTEKSVRNNPDCPKCRTGYLLLQQNQKDGSKFLGCSNYPLCDNTYKQIEILKNNIKCESCGGYMVKRKGKHGKFYGCTNYPYCKNTFTETGAKFFY